MSDAGVMSLKSPTELSTQLAQHVASFNPSMDALRGLLKVLASSTSCTHLRDAHAEPADVRIRFAEQFMQKAVQMPVEELGSVIAEGTAATLLSVWDFLAPVWPQAASTSQSSYTVLPLLLTSLANIIYLLDVHYPTHCLLEPILQQMLPSTTPAFTSQPRWSQLHSFLMQSRNGTDQTQVPEPVTAASLKLVIAMATFEHGKYARRIFEGIRWESKSISRLINQRRRPPTRKRTKAATQRSVSLSHPDIRTLYCLLLLAFLGSSPMSPHAGGGSVGSPNTSVSLKAVVLSMVAEVSLAAILRSTATKDPPQITAHILLALHTTVVCDNRIMRSTKALLFNEWVCKDLVVLLESNVRITDVGLQEDAREGVITLGSIALEFMRSLCTTPGQGICYEDGGWGSRPATHGQQDEGQHGDSQQVVPTVRNKILLGVLRVLSPTTHQAHQTLCLGILRAAPELVAAYIPTCPALSSVYDPRAASSSWLISAAFVAQVLDLPLPSSEAKSSHVPHTPTVESIMQNLLPSPLHLRKAGALRSILEKCISHADALVRLTGLMLLRKSLQRLIRFKTICADFGSTASMPSAGKRTAFGRGKPAILALSEVQSPVPWEALWSSVAKQAASLLPDTDTISALLQDITFPEDRTHEDVLQAGGLASASLVAAESQLQNIALHKQAFGNGGSSADLPQVDLGRLLLSNMMRPDSAVSPGSSKLSRLRYKALCQLHILRLVASTQSDESLPISLSLSDRPVGGRSYLCLLLTVYLATPFEVVRAETERVLRQNKLGSIMDTLEWQVWLEALPKTPLTTTKDLNVSQDVSSTSPVSDEQATVLIFIDDCLGRCTKTLYRYMEAARRLIEKEDLTVSTPITAAISAAPSPLLMTVVEQFEIQVSRDLLDNDSGTRAGESKPETPVGERSALLSFLGRLFALLQQGTSPLSVSSHAVATLAARCSKAVEHSLQGDNNPGPSSLKWLAQVTAYNAGISDAEEVSHLNAQLTTVDSSSVARERFAGSNSVKALRDALRLSQRPLSRPQLQSFLDAVVKLQMTTETCCQVLLELHSGRESVHTATVAMEHIPLAIAVLHEPQVDSLDTFVDCPSSAHAVQRILLRLAHTATSTAVSAPSGHRSIAGTLPMLLSSAIAADRRYQPDLIFEHIVQSAIASLNRIDNGQALQHMTANLLALSMHLATSCLDLGTPAHQAIIAPLARKLAQTFMKNGMLRKEILGSEDSGRLFKDMLPFMSGETHLPLAQCILEDLVMHTTQIAIDCAKEIVNLCRPQTRQDLQDQIIRLLLIHAASPRSTAGLWKLAGNSASIQASQQLGHCPLRRSSSTPASLESLVNSQAFEMLRSASPSFQLADMVIGSICYSIKGGHEAVSQFLREIITSSVEDLRYLGCTLYSCLDLQAHCQDSLLDSLNFQQWETLSATALALCLDGAVACQPIFGGCTRLLAQSLAKGRHGQLDLFVNCLTTASGTSDLAVAVLPCLFEIISDLILALSATAEASSGLQSTIIHGVDRLVRCLAEGNEDDELVKQACTSLTLLVKTMNAKGSALKGPYGTPLLEVIVQRHLQNNAAVRLALEIARGSSLASSAASRTLSSIVVSTHFLDQQGLSPLSRELICKIVLHLAQRDVVSLCTPQLAAVILEVYEGTTCPADTILLYILGLCEGQGTSSLSALLQKTATKWTSAGSSCLDVLLAMDSSVMFTTCEQFPRTRSWHRLQFAQPADAVYDPCFILSLLGAIIASNSMLSFSPLQWSALLRCNALGVAAASLSSRSAEMRQMGSRILCAVYATLLSSGFAESKQAVLSLDVLRNSVSSSTSDGTPMEPVPSTLSLFVAHALRCVGAPASFIYPAVSQFMLQRPSIEATDIPLFYSFLHSASDTHRQEITWMLRFLVTAVRGGGRNEWQILKRRHSWSLLCSLYGQASAFGESGSVRALVENFILASVQRSPVASSLVLRHGLLQWIQQQQRSECARQAASNEAWLLVVDAVVRNVDLSRIDRGTGSSMWVSSALDIVHRCLEARWHIDSRNRNLYISARTTRTLLAHQRRIVRQHDLHQTSEQAEKSYRLLCKLLDTWLAISTPASDKVDNLLRRATLHHIWRAALAMPLKAMLHKHRNLCRKVTLLELQAHGHAARTL